MGRLIVRSRSAEAVDLEFGEGYDDDGILALDVAAYVEHGVRVLVQGWMGMVLSGREILAEVGVQMEGRGDFRIYAVPVSG